MGSDDDENDQRKDLGLAKTVTASAESAGDADARSDADSDDLFRRAAAENVGETDFPADLASRYAAKSLLDHGATASVWHAFDTHIRRDVALKVFDRGSRSLHQVLAEAHAASAVISDHVVPVLDVLSGTRPVIVMDLVAEQPDRGGSELVVGQSAARTTPEHFLEAVRWCAEAARGVNDAHARYVPHRDIKPKNILITPVSRRARVTDFGLAIAGLRDDGSKRNTISMQAGVPSRRHVHIAGTPAYMAPEQAEGLPIDLDMRRPEDRDTLVGIDVFGLGALAHELVTGIAPYEPRHDETNDDIIERARTSLREPVHKLKTRWGGRVPKRMARVIEKAMAHAPKDRYRSARQLAKELNALLTHHPTSHDNFWERPRLWMRRHPSVASLLVVLIACGTVLFFANDSYQEMRNKEQRSHEAAQISQQQVARLENQGEESLQLIKDHLEGALRTQAASTAAAQVLALFQDLAFRERNHQVRDLASKVEEAKRVSALLASSRAKLKAAERDRDQLGITAEVNDNLLDASKSLVKLAESEKRSVQRERDRLKEQLTAAKADAASAREELKQCQSRNDTGIGETRTVQPAPPPP